MRLRWGTLISNMTAYAMMIVCGVNFPLAGLLPAVQSLSRLAPLTHGLVAVRAVVDGAAYAQGAGLVGAELLVGLAYGAAARLLFGYRLQVARRRGDLELV